MPSILAPQITSALYLLCTPSIPATRQLRLRVYMASNHLLSQTCLDTRTNPRHPNCNPSTPSTTISTLLALLWNITSGASGWLFGLIMSRVPRNAKQQMHCSNNIARCILGNPSQLVQVAWCQNRVSQWIILKRMGSNYQSNSSCFLVTNLQLRIYVSFPS